MIDSAGLLNVVTLPSLGLPHRTVRRFKALLGIKIRQDG
jgi:hypothetical protein